jgi:D-xylonolactonase
MAEPARAIGVVRCQLGEGPLWSARDNAIYWVDILAPALHRYSLITAQISSWTMPEKIGWVIERRHRPGFIAGFQSGFYELTLDPVLRKPIHDPEPHLPGSRMNDAKADAWGRIWAGTMDLHGREPCGSLYRLDSNHTVTRQDNGYFITNGPAFGVRGQCMYHTDTGRSVVYRFELTPEGHLGTRTEFRRFPKDWGTPDGMTVDADDGVWIAHWGAGRVSRFRPNGTLDRHILLPTSQITSCVFAGHQLDRLFVTSAAVTKTDEPLAGALFEVDPEGAYGVQPHLFEG